MAQISDDDIAYARAQLADMRDRIARIDNVLAGTGVSPAAAPATSGGMTTGNFPLPANLSEEAVMALSKRVQDLMDAVTRATSVEESLRIYQSQYAQLMQEHADDDEAISRLTTEINNNQDAITRAITANVGIVPATSPMFAPAGVNAGSAGPAAATPAMPNAAGVTLAGSAQTPEGMATAPSPMDAPAATGGAPVPPGLTPGVDMSVVNTTAAPVTGPNPTHNPNPPDNAPVLNPDPTIPVDQQKQAPVPAVDPTSPAAMSNATASNVDVAAAAQAAQDAPAPVNPAAPTPAPEANPQTNAAAQNTGTTTEGSTTGADTAGTQQAPTNQ